MNVLQNYKVYSNVCFGENSTISEFVIIGYPPQGAEPGALKTILGDNVIIRSHTVIYAGNVIGNCFQTGHNVLIREENTIGNYVSIGSGSIIEHHVMIGDNVRIHSHVFVPEFSVLEDGCWLGPNVVLTNALYPRSQHVKETLIGPTIKKGAKVGANATILPGIIVGENALVGAGAVVTKNVLPYSVVVGNPACEINDVRKLVYKDDLVQKVYDL